MRDDDPNLKEKLDERPGVSRRDFLKISGISVAVPIVAGPKVILAAGEEVPVHGPGKVPVEFTINGKEYKANLEPREPVRGDSAERLARPCGADHAHRRGRPLSALGFRLFGSCGDRVPVRKARDYVGDGARREFAKKIQRGCARRFRRTAKASPKDGS